MESKQHMHDTIIDTDAQFLISVFEKNPESELKNELRSRRADLSGTKAELAARLAEMVHAEAIAAAEKMVEEVKKEFPELVNEM